MSTHPITSAEELRRRKEVIEVNSERLARSNDGLTLTGYLVEGTFAVAEQIAALREMLEQWYNEDEARGNDRA